MGEGYREIKKCTGLEGEDFGYIKYPRAEPPFPGSDYITGVKFDRVRYHCGEICGLSPGQRTAVFTGLPEITRACL